MIEITDERYLPYLKVAAYDVLRDGQFHDLLSEIDARIGTVADYLCELRCEVEGRTYSNIALCRAHGRRLLIQDVIVELQPKLESIVIDNAKLYRLAYSLRSKHRRQVSASQVAGLGAAGN